MAANVAFIIGIGQSAIGARLQRQPLPLTTDAVTEAPATELLPARD